MSNEDRGSLFQEINPCVIPIIGAIAVITVALIPFILKSPDFVIYVNPVTGRTLQGSMEHAMVKIKRIRRYKYPVALSTKNQHPAIKVTFIPKGGPTPPYNSTMEIKVDSDVSIGEHTIIIEGIGGDGREHTCRYVLFVKSIPDNGEPTPMFVGSRESDVYHYPNCRYVEMILPENIIWFTSAEDARAH